ncbi:substrate-binding periplasmic protein [Alteromonas gilva]|uniref:Transporter substrate-binding domain-containing protein n=1 Tax=Alteromonas gilva TaxID=2987522 RepID=A0ABT5L845_9ALTE|nr:transporter substrate-binding domain-containing protein [Alteromonas gilva]MDC8832042.1 transporter substrate-binding domain-containing protein [Alteromonas gilva]
MSFRWLVLLAIVSSSVLAGPKLRSAVSPEFPTGLHYELIHYFAEKLDVPADIVLMPYARRLIEVNDGSIDLMVGVSMDVPIGEHIQRIEPPYESLKVALFVRADKADQLTSQADLRQLSIGVTMRSNIQSLFTEIPVDKTVMLPSIEQKIEMLMKGRIDGFTHIQQSTEVKLDELGLQHAITLANYQIDQVFAQHVVINKDSWLWQHKSRLEDIIKAGIACGDFAKIRQRYYAGAGV